MRTEHLLNNAKEIRDNAKWNFSGIRIELELYPEKKIEITNTREAKVVN